MNVTAALKSPTLKYGGREQKKDKFWELVKKKKFLIADMWLLNFEQVLDLEEPFSLECLA